LSFHLQRVHGEFQRSPLRAILAMTNALMLTQTKLRQIRKQKRTKEAQTSELAKNRTVRHSVQVGLSRGVKVLRDESNRAIGQHDLQASCVKTSG
jgi:hypothetical protein